jgi:hypothetical protein
MLLGCETDFLPQLMLRLRTHGALPQRPLYTIKSRLGTRVTEPLPIYEIPGIVFVKKTYFLAKERRNISVKCLV